MSYHDKQHTDSENAKGPKPVSVRDNALKRSSGGSLTESAGKNDNTTSGAGGVVVTAP